MPVLDHHLLSLLPYLTIVVSPSGLCSRPMLSRSVWGIWFLNGVCGWRQSVGDARKVMATAFPTCFASLIRVRWKRWFWFFGNLTFLPESSIISTKLPWTIIRVSLLGSSMSVLIGKQVQYGWVGQKLDYGQVDQPMLPLEWLNALFFSSSLDVSMMVLRALTVTSKSRSLSFCGIDDWTLY